MRGRSRKLGPWTFGEPKVTKPRSTATGTGPRQDADWLFAKNNLDEAMTSDQACRARPIRSPDHLRRLSVREECLTHAVGITEPTLRGPRMRTRYEPCCLVRDVGPGRGLPVSSLIRRDRRAACAEASNAANLRHPVRPLAGRGRGAVGPATTNPPIIDYLRGDPIDAPALDASSARGADRGARWCSCRSAAVSAARCRRGCMAGRRSRVTALALRQFFPELPSNTHLHLRAEQEDAFEDAAMTFWSPVWADVIRI